MDINFTLSAESIASLRRALVGDSTPNLPGIDPVQIRDVIDNLDYKKLADKIDAYEVAQSINLSDIADHIDVDQVAERTADLVDAAQIAECVDYSEIVDNIDLEELALLVVRCILRDEKSRQDFMKSALDHLATKLNS